MITYIKGNLFDSNVDALAHGCNTIGKMNAGIAREFKVRYPEMFDDYKQKCDKGLFLPGEGYIFMNEYPPHIINLATQDRGHAKLSYVDSTLKWLKKNWKKEGLNSVAMPKIASGLGKLEWEAVKELIIAHFSTSKLNLEIWSID